MNVIADADRARCSSIFRSAFRLDFAWTIPEAVDQNRHLRPIIAAEAEKLPGLSFRARPSGAYLRELLDSRPGETPHDSAPDAVVLFGSILARDCDIYPLIHQIRRTFGCPVAAWATDDPYEFDFNQSLAEHVDWLFTNDAGTVPYYAGRGNVSFLPLAAGENAHVRSNPQYLPDDDADWDFCFCGAAFPNRVAIVEGLLPVLSRYRTVIVGRLTGPESWPAPRLPGIDFIEPLPYGDVLDVYRRSRVVLNLSRSFDLRNWRYQITPSTPAPRTYEVAAMGVPQFCFFDRPQMLDDFSADEMAFFDNARDFAHLAEKYIESYPLRRDLGARARRRAQANHLYRHRLQNLTTVLAGLTDPHTGFTSGHVGGNDVSTNGAFSVHEYA